MPGVVLFPEIRYATLRIFKTRPLLLSKFDSHRNGVEHPNGSYDHGRMGAGLIWNVKRISPQPKRDVFRMCCLDRGL